jgi:hypothetical protein
MLRKLIEKLRRRRSWSDKASEQMQDARVKEREEVEAEVPGHGDRAGQIGMFS